MTVVWIPQQAAWAVAAVLVGLGAVILPLSAAVLLLGGILIVFAFYLEPALALIFTLCVAPLKTLIETEAHFTLPADVGQLAFGAFLGVWAVRYVADRKPMLRFSPPVLGAVLVFLLGASLSLWTAYSATAFVTEMIKWVQVLILVLLLPNLKRWGWVLFGLVLSATLQGVIGLWEFMGGSGAAHLRILDYRFFRAFGTFGQPNPFGAFMGMVLPLALGAGGGYLWAAYREKRDRRLNVIIGSLYAVCAMILLGGLLTSWSRGAWLGFIGALGVVVWSFPRNRWLGTGVIAGGAAIFAVLGLMGYLPASLTDRLTGFRQDFSGVGDVRGVIITNDNFAVIERLAHWQAAVGMAESSPLFGVGFGNYEIAYPRFALVNWERPLGHAHNYYLNLLAETGIIGLIAYLVMWGMLALFHWRLFSTPMLATEWRLRGIAVGLLGTWTHITIHSFLDKLYVNNLFLHVGVMLGILAVLILNTQRKPVHDRNNSS